MKKKTKSSRDQQGHYMSHRTPADMHVGGVYFDERLLARIKEQKASQK